MVPQHRANAWASKSQSCIPAETTAGDAWRPRGSVTRWHAAQQHTQQVAQLTSQGSSVKSNMSSSKPNPVPSSKPKPVSSSQPPLIFQPPSCTAASSSQSRCAAAASQLAKHSFSSLSTSRARLSRLRRAAMAMAAAEVGRPCEDAGGL